MLEVLAVDVGSIAAELDIEAGDRLLAVNGRPVRDLLDVETASRGEELCLEIQKPDGEVWLLEFEKDAEEPLGMQLPHPEPTQCDNQCIFCFVHQLPKGLRKTLYIKDEDYRFSYLYGAYITLTNLAEEDFQRIAEQHLSPLYISVHATDEAVRQRLLGRPAPAILPLLQRLIGAGIELHTQIVLCPGVNDGPVLRQTVEDLHALAPGVRSLAVVPVGLTGFRDRLPALRPPTAAESRDLLAVVHEYQQRFLQQGGSRFVFAADEFYLKAGEDFPPLDAYEELSQLENGVGTIPLFREEAQQVLAEAEPLPAMTVSTVTGQSSAAEVRWFTDALSEKTGARILLHEIPNDFFGGYVTVTGLVSGGDILRRLQGQTLGDALLIPDVMLKADEDIFLDDVSLEDLARALQIRVEKVESTPWGLLEGLEWLAPF